jgi:thiamine-monophosphate kinase
MRVFELGERRLVERISRLLKNDDLGDDCAVVPCGSELLVVSTDMLHRKTDFPPQMKGYQIGWMSAAVNLSDVAAMGAIPVGLLFALGLPESLEVGFVDEIIRGVKACADYARCAVIGGDVDRHDELTIVGTALGRVSRAKILRRRGAKVGDAVCVTGSLGGAGAALYAITHSLPCPRELARRLFEPVPRIGEGIALGESGVVTAMMDISDGLAASLYELSRANRGIGFKIYADKIPVHMELERLFPEKTLAMSLYEGGDFELLFTAARNELKSLKEVVDFTVIGEVIEKHVLLEKKDAQGRRTVEPLAERGYEPFGGGVVK